MSLRPTLANGRLKKDISRSLVGGPTACEARLEKGSLIACGRGSSPTGPLFTQILAFGSSGPIGLAPLNRKWARPSQKLE